MIGYSLSVGCLCETEERTLVHVSIPPFPLKRFQLCIPWAIPVVVLLRRSLQILERLIVAVSIWLNKDRRWKSSFPFRSDKRLQHISCRSTCMQVLEEGLLFSVLFQEVCGRINRFCVMTLRSIHDTHHLHHQSLARLCITLHSICNHDERDGPNKLLQLGLVVRLNGKPHRNVLELNLHRHSNVSEVTTHFLQLISQLRILCHVQSRFRAQQNAPLSQTI